MATGIKTVGVAMTFNNGSADFNKTINGMSATNINTADKALNFAKNYGEIVDGSLKGVKFVETTPVTVDD